MSWQNFTGQWAGPFSMSWFGPFFWVLLAWSIVWKGLALWKAAHRESKPWFVALLVINTAGILEILYLYVFSKPGSRSSTALCQLIAFGDSRTFTSW